MFLMKLFKLRLQLTCLWLNWFQSCFNSLKKIGCQVFKISSAKTRKQYNQLKYISSNQRDTILQFSTKNYQRFTLNSLGLSFYYNYSNYFATEFWNAKENSKRILKIFSQLNFSTKNVGMNTNLNAQWNKLCISQVCFLYRYLHCYKLWMH